MSPICRCQRSGMRSRTRSAAPRSPSACSSPAPACISKGLLRPSLAAAIGVVFKLVADARARDRARAVVRSVRHQPRRSSRSARRCRPRPAPMCWRGRWAAMRRCWRRSSRCRRFWRRSRCRSRSRWSRAARARQPHRLHHRRQIVQPVQHDGQPGRLAAIAHIAEPEADAEDLAEEEPVVLQVQRRSRPATTA